MPYKYLLLYTLLLANKLQAACMMQLNPHNAISHLTSCATTRYNCLVLDIMSNWHGTGNVTN